MESSGPARHRPAGAIDALKKAGVKLRNQMEVWPGRPTDPDGRSRRQSDRALRASPTDETESVMTHVPLHCVAVTKGRYLTHRYW